MLVIGDIHITSKYKDKILTSLRDFIASQPEEKTLIFLWDFVYHFSYDRGALLALYDLFLELYQQGKSLYILAGNHDRLGGSFVFEEAKKAFETLSGFFANAQNDIYDKMHFITSPTLTEIEGEQICFLPYMLDVNLGEYSGIEQLQDDFYHEQIQTENKNQILSAKLHLLVQYFKNHQPNLTFIHHYYFDGVAFPGQKSKFSFRDVALSSQWLEDRDLHFISGHLHQSFAYKNYLCTGSVWATSPLEENQLKGVWKLSEGKRSFYEFGGNFYFAMDCLEQASSLFDSTSKVLEADDVQRHHEVLKEAFKKNFGWWQEIGYHFLPAIDLKNVILSLRVDELNYQKMDTFVALELQHQLSDVKLKKQQTNVEDLLQQLQRPDAVSLQGFGGWIDLLKDFLKRQYPENYQEYEKLLYELKLL